MNGCTLVSESFDLDAFEETLTTMSARMPKSLHMVPAPQLLMRNSVFLRLRRRAFPASNLSGFASHLYTVQPCDANILKTLTSGTILARLLPAKLAPGNQQYKVQVHISLDENVHPDI